MNNQSSPEVGITEVEVVSNAEIEVTSTEPFDSYHARNCKICRHPDRPAIENDFVQWHTPSLIARAYDVPWRSIYRHAQAVGLFDRRRRNLRSSLEFIIEDASRVPPTANGVIRAVQLYARINDEGQLVEAPKTQVIVIARDGATSSIPVAPGVKIVQNSSVEAQLTAQSMPLLSAQQIEARTDVAIEVQREGVPISDCIPCGAEAEANENRIQLDNQNQTENGLTH